MENSENITVNQLLDLIIMIFMMMYFGCLFSHTMAQMSSFISVKVVGETEEIVKTGCWVGDCFIYTNSVNRLNYYVGGEIVTIAHLDR